MSREYLIIHHTGAEEKDTSQIRRYHKSLGWQDIGYHFVIERSGLVAPGRSPDQPGAHCIAGCMNTKSLGIALIGNLEEHPPRPEQVEALIELLGRLIKQYHIPLANILGHREVPGAATACPGKYFPLAEVREKLQTRPSPAVPGDDKTVRSVAAQLPDDYEQPPTSSLWIVQAGAFSTRERAEQYAEKLKRQGIEVFVRK
ncbi:N-acetylmuramoyl-L-alanine amidase [Desulfoscipio gibsoniae]|uniref:Negative regulator of beta-lactamase expression n=1 Tax=Desulfoscipio gibsoniae DSM 7213 TaxID=767817 RepID=R4KCG3_9FIRM|nr:N-acetylmuramoyl-L-alanine amidase [Desulfoscipio gibsoniae]AGL00264.1 negative regulator of beta-lactamase expression [Desulfoscipio gibsoniae DSM 7213]